MKVESIRALLISSYFDVWFNSVPQKNELLAHFEKEGVNLILEISHVSP